VSIGKRFVNLFRSNLTSLFDRSSRDRFGRPLEELSDGELEEELRRRRSRREAAERAASDPEQEAWDEVERAVREGSGRFRTSGGRRSGSYRRVGSTPGPTGGASRRPASAPARDPRLAQFYAQLECPYGADLTAVRKQYRALMLKYHPDMHSGNPEKQRLATELSQRLTMAYNELRRSLGG
jgi:DnaJ-domain-containing protein 1